jgi:predicted transcriptional regulator
MKSPPRPFPPETRPYRPRTKPDKITLEKLYVEQGLALREIAAILGRHHQTIKYHLESYGITTRPNAKRSTLRPLKLEAVERRIKTLGIRGYARELGVHENTLRNYLKAARGSK